MDDEKAKLNNRREALKIENMKLKKEYTVKVKDYLGSVVHTFIAGYPNMPRDPVEGNFLAFGSCFHVKLNHYDREWIFKMGSM